MEPLPGDLLPRGSNRGQGECSASFGARAFLSGCFVRNFHSGTRKHRHDLFLPVAFAAALPEGELFVANGAPFDYLRERTDVWEADYLVQKLVFAPF